MSFAGLTHAREAYIPSNFFSGASFFETSTHLKEFQYAYYFPAALEGDGLDMFVHYKPSIFGYQHMHIIHTLAIEDHYLGFGVYATSVDDIPVAIRGSDLRPEISSFTSHSMTHYFISYTRLVDDDLSIAIKGNGFFHTLDGKQGTGWSLGFGGDFSLTDWLNVGAWVFNGVSPGLFWDDILEVETISADFAIFWRFYLDSLEAEITHNFQSVRLRSDWALNKNVSFFAFGLFDLDSGLDYWMRQYGVGLGFTHQRFGIQYVYQWNHLDSMLLGYNSIAFRLGL